MRKFIITISLLLIFKTVYAGFFDTIYNFNYLQPQPDLAPILGAPVSNIFRSLVPEANDTYHIGTTSPSRWWRFGFINYASTTSFSSFEEISIGRSSTTTIAGDSATSTFNGQINADLLHSDTQLVLAGLLNCDTLDTDANGVVKCGSDASGGAGTTEDLQDAYNLMSADAQITTTDNKDLIFFSADTATDANVIVALSPTGGGQFQVADANGSATTTRLVITRDGSLGIGTTSPGTGLAIAATSTNIAGRLTVDDHIKTGLLTATSGLSVLSGTVALPAGEIGNAELANSSLTYTAGAGLTGGGTVSLGGSATIDVGAGTGITVNANDVALTVPVAISSGGTNNTSAYTAGSVIFSDGASLTQNNSRLFWDNTNFRLGVASGTPGSILSVQGHGNLGSLIIEGAFKTGDAVATSTLGVATGTPGYALGVTGQAIISATTTVGGLIIDNNQTGTTTVSVGDIGNPACLETRDTDNAGWSQTYWLDGILYVEDSQCTN